VPQVVFVPGVFGCSMYRAGDNFQLWPPVGQAVPISVQERVDGLLDPKTRAGDIIQWIEDPFLHQPEYGPILRAIGRMQGVTLSPFPYDWRKDLTADLPNALAAFLDSLPRGQRLILVAHSMGGLIVRWLLESGHYNGRSWFADIDQFVAISVPHLGAPLALFRTLGLDSFEPIVFDRFACKQLASRPDLYPAGHQLMPTSALDTVTFADGSHSTVEAAFPSIPAVGFSALDRLHAVLDKFQRPKAITYQLAYGRGLATVSAIRATAVNDPAPVECSDSGDTTVPIWSGCPSIELVAAKGCFEEAAFDNASHVGILHDPRLLNQLQIWITGTTVPMA
jgi:pimeloyl-ACP methyl ester carboxylesterase